MDVEREVERHYGRGGLEARILEALAEEGRNVEALTPDDLMAADEFHLGWRAATDALAKDLGLTDGMRVLDVGSGVGGPARHFAAAYGARVTGIDLTAEFVEVATSLTRRCGLEDLAIFRCANATRMPFDDASFDRVTLIHVGMNIADKAAVFAETRRVMKPGDLFGLYEVMRVSEDEIPYPMPWSQTIETSFVETPATYRALLEAAGFEVEAVADRSALALQLSQKMREKVATEGAPALGLHVVMGPASAERMQNVMKALSGGIIAPVQIVARAVG